MRATDEELETFGKNVRFRDTIIILKVPFDGSAVDFGVKGACNAFDSAVDELGRS